MSEGGDLVLPEGEVVVSEANLKLGRFEILFVCKTGLVLTAGCMF